MATSLGSASTAKEGPCTLPTKQGSQESESREEAGLACPSGRGPGSEAWGQCGPSSPPPRSSLGGTAH